MAERKDSGISSSTVGFSMISVLSNLAYAGMRAQGSKDNFARFASFWVGFPGTLLTYIFVEEGSERAYGVDLPRRLPRAK